MVDAAARQALAEKILELRKQCGNTAETVRKDCGKTAGTVWRLSFKAVLNTMLRK